MHLQNFFKHKHHSLIYCNCIAKTGQLHSATTKGRQKGLFGKTFLSLVIPFDDTSYTEVTHFIFKSVAVGNNFRDHMEEPHSVQLMGTLESHFEC